MNFPQIELFSFEPVSNLRMTDQYSLIPDKAINPGGGMLPTPITWTASLYSEDVFVTVVQNNDEAREEDVLINHELLQDRGQNISNTARQIAQSINVYLDEYLR